MKRTLGIGTGRISKRKPRVPDFPGVDFKRRRSRAKRRRPGIWYIVYPDGSRQSTRQALASQAELAATLALAMRSNYVRDDVPDEFQPSLFAV